MPPPAEMPGADAPGAGASQFLSGLTRGFPEMIGGAMAGGIPGMAGAAAAGQADYLAYTEMLKRLASGASPQEKASLFAGTAARFYGLEDLLV